MEERAWLLKNGVPWDRLDDMPDEERLAYSVLFGQLDGGVFQWGSLTWKDRSKK